jgi:hypothetical protein
MHAAGLQYCVLGGRGEARLSFRVSGLEQAAAKRLLSASALRDHLQRLSNTALLQEEFA